MAGGKRNRNRINSVPHKNGIDGHITNVTNNVPKAPSAQSLPNVQSLPVCHPHIPKLEGLGNMTFELLFISYLQMALFCQYVYLFKTIWWYPLLLPPSTYALNFHLIDKQLTVFIALILGRRIVWSLLWDVFRPRSDNNGALMLWLLGCFFLSLIWMIALLVNLFYLYYESSFLTILMLCYPLILWIPVSIFFSDSSSVHLILSWLSVSDCERQRHSDNSMNNSAFRTPMSRLLDEPETIGDLRTSYANLGNALDANQVRFEVKLLCRDFNSRISEILVCSMISAYYVGLVPLFFMKAHQYYDRSWCLQHTALVLVNSFLYLSAHLLHPRYLHVLHKCASLLGGYKLVDDPNQLNDENIDQLPLDQYKHPVQILQWTKLTVFSRDVYVCYKDKYYKTLCNHNTAEPGDLSHYRFYYMFSDPLRILNWLVVALFVIVIYQIQLIIVSSKWDQLITLALMQFFSYYNLFRTLHDRIVLGKAYSVHKQIYLDKTL